MLRDDKSVLFDAAAEYYPVKPGDYCNKIILKYSISLNDFLFLNQGINHNCTNLFSNEFYCISPIGSIDKYPGAPGYINSSTSYSDMPYSNYPKTTYTPPVGVNQTKLLPVAPGTRKDCFFYLDAPELQFDVARTFYTSPCEAVAEAWDKRVQELETWNPSINANGACTFSPSYGYCMDPYRPTADVSATTSTPAPVPSTSSITMSSSTTATASTTTAAGGAPGPTQSGFLDACNKWHLVTSSDETCATVAAEYDISLKQFYAWNPAMTDDCVGGFSKDQAYCVGVAK